MIWKIQVMDFLFVQSQNVFTTKAKSKAEKKLDLASFMILTQAF